MQIKTYDELLEQALSLVPNTIDKREGSLIYTAIAPVCTLLAQSYIELQSFYELSFIDTSVGEYLDRIAHQFGVVRKSAAKCIKKAEFVFEGDVQDLLQEKFSINNVFFTATQKLSNSEYLLTADEGGTFANTIEGEILASEYIPSLKTATIIETVSFGTNEEDDDSFKTRIVNFIKYPAFGGNIADYTEKVLSISGVEYTKIFTAADLTAGHVGIVVGNTNAKAVEKNIVDNVSALYMREDGSSLAPIGHMVSVKSAVNFTVNVYANVSFQPNVDKTYVIENIKAEIQKFILEYPFETEIIPISKISACISLVNGVVDVTNIKLNDNIVNITLPKVFDDFKVAVCGEITIEEALV